jgi:DNA invertase Pin-like site-specific DNA recombinase
MIYGKKITAIYLRLSREDEEICENENSNSIENQRIYLTDYAKKQNFKNVHLFIDDGVSGTNFNRRGFKNLFELIESGMVKTLIVKDMSRLGRNYLEVGRLTEEILPMYSVRFIAVNDGVDSEKIDDDFTLFRNIMNEWYSKDISRKCRLALKLKDKQGFASGFLRSVTRKTRKTPKSG